MACKKLGADRMFITAKLWSASAFGICTRSVSRRKAREDENGWSLARGATAPAERYRPYRRLIFLSVIPAGTDVCDGTHVFCAASHRLPAAGSRYCT